MLQPPPTPEWTLPTAPAGYGVQGVQNPNNNLNPLKAPGQARGATPGGAAATGKVDSIGLSSL